MFQYALAAFCAILPVYLIRFSVPLAGFGSVPSTLLEACFWALFAWWSCTDGRKRAAWRALDDWALPLTLFLTGSLVALAVSPDMRAALGLWRAYVLEPLLFFVMFTDVLGRSKRGTLVLSALGATLTIVGLTAVYQKITGWNIPNPIWQAAATRRVTAFYGFPNAIGLMAAPITVIMSAWAWSLIGAVKRAPRERLLGLVPAAAALLGTLAIIFAVSQGAMIGLAAGLAIFGLLDKRLRAWTLGAGIATCIVIMAWPRALNEITALATLSDDSGSVRRIIWNDTWRMLMDHPVFGAGLSGYPIRIAPYHDAYWIEIFQYPHDIILNFWSEMGLIGLAGFIWILARFFSRTVALWRARGAGDSNASGYEWLPAALIASMTALLVHGLVDVPYFKNDLAFLFWIIVGLAAAMRKRLKDA